MENKKLFEHKITHKAKVHYYRSFGVIYLPIDYIAPYFPAVLRICLPSPVRWTRMNGS